MQLDSEQIADRVMESPVDLYELFKDMLQGEVMGEKSISLGNGEALVDDETGQILQKIRESDFDNLKTGNGAG